MKKHFILLSAAVFLLLPGIAQDKAPQLNEGNIGDVVKAMTLEEKAGLVVGAGMRFGGGPAVGLTEEKVPGAAGTTLAIPRVGIPSIVLADGPAGLRIKPIRDNDSTKTYYCTAFPVASLIASTWDTGLAEEVGKAMGSELLAYGVDVLLAPALNIHRNPLCGRNFEYFSEDPYAAGIMAASVVKGVQSLGVGTSLKHFAANNTETNRQGLNTIVSERALREIYLKGFEIAVRESDPWTVMSSYNLINGTYTSESHGLLTLILRDEWGFRGLVMTDWFGGKDPVAQMIAGNDLLMPGIPDQKKAIMEAVENGKLEESILDRNVERILEVIVRSPSFKGLVPSNDPDLKKHAAIARQAGAEGMVLLENRGTALPLTDHPGTMAVFGNTSYEMITGGTGSGDVNEAYSVSLVDGLANAGLQVDRELMDQYARYKEDVLASRPPKENWWMPDEPVPEMEAPADELPEIAGRTGMALITLGRKTGEFRDRSVAEFYLNDTEKELIEKVTDAYHAQGKKVVVILNVGGPVETATWSQLPDAVLLAWQAGQETGNSIADVLTGKINPSGKLATTFPVRYEDEASAKNFPGKELPTEEAAQEDRRSFMRAKPSEIVYEEDIYVGYRYHDAAGIEPAYPFGYGISYTQYEYGKLRLSSKKFSGSLSAELEITNTGSVPGREIVQFYLSAPATGLNKPAKELKAFVKTALLEPGESETVSVEIGADDLASFDTGASAWIAEKGKYTLTAGASSRDLRKTATFKLPSQLTTSEVHKVLEPLEPIEILKL